MKTQQTARMHTLTPSELETVYAYAEQRNAKGFTGSVDIEPEQAHIRGMKGEVAFAECYGLEPDLSINRDGGDDGHDFEAAIHGAHRTIDVKTTTYTNDPWLKVRADRIQHGPEIYVLGVVDGINIGFVGWVPKDRLQMKAPTRETGTTNHICKPGELLPMFDQHEITEQEQ